MARHTTRSNDWGFPRWRGYGSGREAQTVRLCDRHGCEEPGTCPAPKSPNSPERWYFCQTHAGEYNRGWNYFEGLSAEEAAEREANERRDAGGFAQSKHQAWAGPGDGWRLDGLYGQYVYVANDGSAAVTITAHEETRDHRLVEIAAAALRG